MSLNASKSYASSVSTHKAWNYRFFILFGVFGLSFLILIGALGYRQLILHDSYKQQEEQQSLRRILQPGSRGNIYDRNGKLLVGNRPRFSVVAYLGELRGEFRQEYIKKIKELKKANTPYNRAEVQKKTRTEVLQKYLHKVNHLIGRNEQVNQRELERHFQQRILLPLTLINDLTPEEFAKLTEQIPVESPIQLYTDSSRYYPYGSSAAHAIGYVVSAPEPTEDAILREDLTTFKFKGKVGKSGLEKSFDWLLQGDCGGEIWRVDPAGFRYANVSKLQPTQGNHLHTSLDIDLQIAAERALGGKTGAIVVLNVKTGEVLALVSSPTYDLNELTPYIPSATYDKISEQGGWLNRAIQGLYPPGSIFKMLTAIAAYRANVLQPNEIFHCEGRYAVGTRKFPCNRRWGHGDIDISEAIKMSCNVLFYDVSQKMSIAHFTDEMIRFGMDKPTGIELPYETHNMLVPTPEWKRKRQLGPWYGGDSANMSIGQGYMLLTPLNMACFAASLARGETLTKPTLVHQTDSNVKINHGGEPIGISNEAYLSIIEGMERGAQDGLARRCKVSGLRIAAKTGTAQVKSHGKDLDLAWFLGIAPIEDPEIAIVAMVEEQDDDDNYWGSTIAAPIGRAIFEKWNHNKSH